MLGTEPDIRDSYVTSGQVKLVFWPVLNHGNPSVYSTVTAVCVGLQNPDLFWDAHHTLFENQRDLYGADRDYYVNLAVDLGADEAAFTTCYDGGEGLDLVTSLDAIRRERGIFSQPTFEVNGTILVGQQSFMTFTELIDSNLP